MKIFDRIFKNTMRGLVKSDKILNFSYESNTLKTINEIIKSLGNIEKFLIYTKNNFNVNDKLKNEFKGVIYSYNNLIKNEETRISSNKGGIFLSGDSLNQDEKRLNRLYLEHLSNAIIEDELSIKNLKKIQKIIKEFNFFNKRLIIYLSKE